jgi:hypothetical protein
MCPAGQLNSIAPTYVTSQIAIDVARSVQFFLGTKSFSMTIIEIGPRPIYTAGSNPAQIDATVTDFGCSPKNIHNAANRNTGATKALYSSYPKQNAIHIGLINGSKYESLPFAFVIVTKVAPNKNRDENTAKNLAAVMFAKKLVNAM